MNTTYNYILTDYKTWLDTLGFCEGSVYEYPLRVKDFFAWLKDQGVSRITELKQSHITEYYKYLESKPN